MEDRHVRHSAFKFIRLPWRDEDLSRYLVYCLDPSHDGNPVDRTITLWGARWAARRHTSEQAILAKARKQHPEYYNTDSDKSN